MQPIIVCSQLTVFGLRFDFGYYNLRLFVTDLITPPHHHHNYQDVVNE
jgi:hypothetical protein